MSRGPRRLQRFIPSDVLAELSTSADVGVRSAVAAHPASPPEILEALAANSDYWVLAALAGNPCTPASALRRFGIDGVDLEALAANPNCPAEILEGIAAGSCMHDVRCDGDACQWEGVDREDVLAGILMNPSTPATLIESLYNRNIDSYEMPFAVVHAETDPERLAEWASHDEMYVRRDLARNLHLSAATLAVLASEDDPVARSTKLSPTHPNCPPSSLVELLRKGVTADLMSANPNCPADILEKVAADGHHPRVIASNPSCPPSALHALTAHSDSAVRARVAANRATSPQSSWWDGGT